jgi:hypothetical protein
MSSLRLPVMEVDNKPDKMFKVIMSVPVVTKVSILYIYYLMFVTKLVELQQIAAKKILIQFIGTAIVIQWIPSATK